MDQKVDKRIRRTKNRLKEGLAALLEEKNINEITVKELVESVDINRSTFYLHYSDIYNMLEVVKKELLDEITTVIGEYPVSPFSENSVPFMKDIFHCLGKNRRLYRALMGVHGDMAFVQQIEDLVADKCLAGLKKQFPNEMNVLNYSYRFCLRGCVGMIQYWLEKEADKAETPEEMAELAFQFIISVARRSRPTGIRRKQE